jgi:site-specific DNA recombinase
MVLPKKEGITMRTAFGYVRVSTSSGQAIEAQRRCLRDHCRKNSLHLAAVFEDAGVSGMTPLGNRPAGRRLLTAAAGCVVIVTRLDRLFRSAADAAETIADFERMGIELISIVDNINTTHPE